MAAEVTGERLLQDGDLDAHAAPGQLGQDLRVQRAAVRPGEDLGDERTELDRALVATAVRDPAKSRSCSLKQL